MKPIWLHCVYDPKVHLFTMTVDLGTTKHTHRLTALELATTVGHGKAQLADATDATLEYTLRFPDGDLTFKQGRDAFTGLVAYLDRVQTSWLSWKRKHPDLFD